MPHLIDVPLYQPMQPYYYDIDNIPILQLANNEAIINQQTDYHSNLLNAAQGTAANLGARLNKCMDGQGNLLQAAVNEANHNIADHAEATPLVGDSYVVMKNSERQQLASISPDGATNLKLSVTTNVGVTDYTNEHVTLEPSSSITWTTSGNQIAAQLVYAGTFHQHIYEEHPNTTNRTLWTVQAGVFDDQTLRVYINGVRIFVGTPTPVPSYNLTSGVPTSWRTINIVDDGTYHPAVGTFSTSQTLTVNDVIRVDYDIVLT